MCTIELEWIGSGEPKRLSHKVSIIGVQKPDNYFYIRYSPQECEFVHQYILCVCGCNACVRCYFLFFLFPDKYIAGFSSKEGNDMLLIIFMYLSSQYNFTAEIVFEISLTLCPCMTSGLVLMSNNYCFTVSL